MGTVGTAKRRAYDAIFRFRNEHPSVQPVLHAVNRLVRVAPPVRFRGWGMTTTHDPPWCSGDRDSHFRASLELVRTFEFTGEAGITADDVDQLAWRHWFVTFCARWAAATKVEGQPVHGAEFGVADGTTAFFALRELTHLLGPDEVRFHLFDAWGGMRRDLLMPGEAIQGERYENLSIDATRRNLANFEHQLSWHVGYVPETLDEPGALPDTIAYAHIDLNTAASTLAVCERVWSRLVPGGVLLFDDYGWTGFEDTKRVVDDFAETVDGLVLTMPTAQAVILKRS